MEAALHGLAYTLLAHAAWAACKWPPTLIPTPDIVGLSVSAIVLGLAIAVIMNCGAIFKIAQFLRISQESSWPTIWETSFREFRKSIGEYVVLHLDDHRRVKGAIRGVANNQEEGHICLENAMWLTKGGEDVPVGSFWIMFNTKDVRCVQFLKASGVSENGRQQPAGPAAATAATTATATAPAITETARAG